MKSFSQVYFDNFIKAGLIVVCLIFLYLLAAYFDMVVITTIGIIITSIIALFLTLYQFHKRK